MIRAVGPIDVASFDPALAAPSSLAGVLEYWTCGTLMAFRDAPGRAGESVRPEAAVGLPTISRNRRSYLFKVRRGLRFSNGSPLTAANFARALVRVRSRVMRSPGAKVFSDVRRVRARGLHLRVELSRSSGDLLMRLALPYACPVPLRFPIDPAGIDLKVGSGPYYLARHVPGSSLLIRRNRNYRGSRPRRVHGLVLTVRGDIDKDIKTVEAGRADLLAVEIPGELRPGLARRFGVNRGRLFRIRGAYDAVLVLNTSRSLFKHNISLRRAVNFAVDRAAVLDSAAGARLSATPTDQIMPRWIPGWRDYRLYPLSRRDLRRARRFARGHLRRRKAILWSVPGAAFPDKARVIASNLHAIGLEVEVKVLAVPALNAKAGTPGAPYDMILADFPLDYPDPANALVRLLGGANSRKRSGNDNYAYFDVPVYNRRMAAAERQTGAHRLRTYSRIDAEIMRNQAPWVPLYENSKWLLISKRVGCFKLHPVFRFDLGTVCLR